jgi:hypothetical protein
MFHKDGDEVMQEWEKAENVSYFLICYVMGMLEVLQGYVRGAAGVC